MCDDLGRDSLMKWWTISLVAEVGARVEVEARSFSDAAAKAKDLFVEGCGDANVYNFPYIQSLLRECTRCKAGPTNGIDKDGATV